MLQELKWGALVDSIQLNYERAMVFKHFAYHITHQKKRDAVSNVCFLQRFIVVCCILFCGVVWFILLFCLLFWLDHQTSLAVVIRIFAVF